MHFPGGKITCLCWSRRGVGAVRSICTIRRIKTQVVWLCIRIWHRARGAAVVLVGAELAKGRPGAVPWLLVVVKTAVRRRGDRQSRGLLRFVQAVVTVWGNLVRMHICVQVLKNPRHLGWGTAQPRRRCVRKKWQNFLAKSTSQIWNLFVSQNASPCKLWQNQRKVCPPLLCGLWLSATVGCGSAFMREWEGELLCLRRPMSIGLHGWLLPTPVSIICLGLCFLVVWRH